MRTSSAVTNGCVAEGSLQTTLKTVHCAIVMALRELLESSLIVRDGSGRKFVYRLE